MWIDQDLCTGDGLCVDHCPEVFVLLEDGISYVHDGQWVGNDPGQWDSLVSIPEELPEIRSRAIHAAEVCPGECIFIEIEAERPVPGARLASSGALSSRSR